ncbi:MAG TPA: hypothetical protein VFX31_06085, partial [Ktedonobacterales bacterium]|nr:hypothetical protein [Ktedonobacterales bacterium]
MLTPRSPARHALVGLLAALLAILGIVATPGAIAASAAIPAASAGSSAATQRALAASLCPANARLRSAESGPPAQFAQVIH